MPLRLLKLTTNPKVTPTLPISSKSYGRRVALQDIAMNHDESDSEEEEGPFVSLSDSENDDLEVSFVSHASKESVSPPSVGPQGETRKLVLGALKSLGRQLWKSPIIHTVEVRKHARVPIIATGTHLGFEGDIALGGHNGTDTSQYASITGPTIQKVRMEMPT